MICGVSFYVQIVAIQKKGPVFVTAFQPLTTILVAIMGLFILGDALHMGRYACLYYITRKSNFKIFFLIFCLWTFFSIVGALLIFVGLYAILSGKHREKDKTIVKNTNTDQQGVDGSNSLSTGGM